MSIPDRSFTLAGYQSMVKHFLAQGYKISDFTRCDPKAKDLVLRHDVDMSLAYAEKMAQAEQEIGVTSTYFVLLRHGLYNLWSRDNAAALLRIKAMGHKIGLHFDASLYDPAPASLEKAAQIECGILETMISDKVDIISFHRPADDLINHNEPLAGRAHTYMQRYTRDMHYFADSRGEWRMGSPFDTKLERSLQLLTHPVWWVFRADMTSLDKLAVYLGDMAEDDKRVLGQNCRLYLKYLNDQAA